MCPAGAPCVRARAVYGGGEMPSDDLAEFSEGPEIAALQGELEASLAAGVVPNGWQRRIQWSTDGGNLHLAPTAVLIVGGAVTCGLVWGWRAGLAAIFAAVGVRLLLSVRGGPRPGQMITESFIPPDETLSKVGIAGHQVFGATRSRPEFSVTRIATPADRRWVRRGSAAIGAGLVFFGTLGLLLESHVIGPVAFLRTASLVEATVCAVFAVWTWRQYGRIIPLLDPTPAADEPWLGSEVLDNATTGSTTETVGEALLSRLPLKVNRVLVPVLVVLFGAMSVLVAFNLTPDRSEVWSGFAAATELIVFVLAGVRGVVLAIASVIQRDWAALRSAVWIAVLMALLLLVAKIFDWLDNWAIVIDSVRGYVG